LAPGAVGHGLGRLAYSPLLSLLRADRMHCVVAVVAEPNPASVALHESLGFELVGILRGVGRKFDRWADTLTRRSRFPGRTGGAGERAGSGARDWG